MSDLHLCDTSHYLARAVIKLLDLHKRVQESLSAADLMEYQSQQQLCRALAIAVLLPPIPPAELEDHDTPYDQPSLWGEDPPPAGEVQP